MIDAMDRFRMLPMKATQKTPVQQPASNVQFGQKTTPMHSQPKPSGDVFVKSIKAADASQPAVFKAEKPVKTQNPLGAALKNFVQQASKINFGSDAVKTQKQATSANQLQNAPFQQVAMNQKNMDRKVSLPGQLIVATQPTSAQANHKMKAPVFAGAAASSAGLSALTATVAAPAALVAKPTLLNQLIGLLPK